MCFACRTRRPNLGHVSAAVSRVDVMNKLVHEVSGFEPTSLGHTSHACKER